MATIGNTNPTLADLAKRLDPNGKVDKIVEILSAQNEILADMAFVEGNLPTGTRTSVRAGLPTAAWRLLNYGIQPSKSRAVQVTDSCGMLEAYAEIDKALADLNGNAPAFRLSEDVAFLESMNKTMATAIFYGNTAVNPEQFVGLAPRYSAISGAANGGNVLSGGGSSANTSIWLVIWGPNTVHGIYPKGSKAGITHTDLGQVTLLDAEGGRYEGYRTHYKWDIGLTLRDWRFVVRIPNIATGSLTKNAGTGADLIDLMTQALDIPPSLSVGRPVFYCNRTIKSFLRRQVNNKSNVLLSESQVGGQPVLSFAGIPVRRCDAITNAETTVS